MKMKNQRRKIGFLLLIILLLNFPIFLVSASEMKVFYIALSVDNTDSVELNFLEINKAMYVDESIEQEEYGDVFLLKMFSDTGNILHEVYFSPDFIIYTDPPVFLNETSVSLNLPYHEDAGYIKVYHNGDEKLVADISEFLCNNNEECDSTENYYSCPSDCEINASDGICVNAAEELGLTDENGRILNYWKDGYCDPDCYKDDDCGPPELYCTEGQTKSCGSNVGVCSAGVRNCTNSQWTDCIGSIGPCGCDDGNSECIASCRETCDGLDNDCDGITNEENVCAPQNPFTQMTGFFSNIYTRFTGYFLGLLG